MAAEKKTSPNVESRLRHNILKMPQEVYAASGIVINGRRLKSFVFTTDLAIIRNCDADAVFAVYPFTPQQAISDAIIKASYIPVFCGVGGGTTHGVRTLNLARDVESQGAMGVVLNSPISDLNLLAVSRVVDIPVIITVTKENTNIQSRIDSGARPGWWQRSGSSSRMCPSLPAAARPARAFPPPLRRVPTPLPTRRPLRLCCSRK